MNAVLDGRTVWFAGGFKDGYRGHAIAEVWNYDIDEDRYTAAPLLPEPNSSSESHPHALIHKCNQYVVGQPRAEKPVKGS